MSKKECTGSTRAQGGGGCFSQKVLYTLYFSCFLSVSFSRLLKRKTMRIFLCVMLCMASFAKAENDKIPALSEDGSCLVLQKLVS